MSASQDELGPEDSVSHTDDKISYIRGWSDVDRHLPSIRSSLSQEVESTDIQIDDITNRVYHTRHPELSLPADDIQDAEIIKLRSTFPEPFSRDDPSPLRRPPEYPPIGFSGPVPSGSGNRPSQNPPSGNAGGSPGGDPPNNPSGGAGGNPNDDNFGNWHHNARSCNNLNPSGNPGGDPGPSPNNSDDERDSHNDPHERARFTSLEPALAQKREWTYDPTPRSREELLLAAFGPIEELIRSTLHSSPDGGNSNIQKTLIQSLPKPGTYGGENDMTIFDNWVKDFVRWLSITGLNGREVCWSYTKGSYVLTSVDIQRTNAVSMFLTLNVKRWLHDVVERIPDAAARNEPLQGRYTFLQVIAGLYQQFIHDASLNKVADMYDSVTYSQSQGVEGLFEKLKNLTLRLPTPPDVYNFRKCLMLLIPEHIGNVMTSIHKVTAEKSTLTEIMETAISIEQGEAAREYYQEARRRLEHTRCKRSRSRSRNRRPSRSRKHGNNNSHGSSKHSGLPKRLQVVDGCLYSVKPYNQRRDD
ncbi:hypothetical protein L218DRAFT_990528 [Marasmius fiardii PR-910]|nr:hypothetical protein L218DRAFT_990528 [Marasmius fiardii PR-910]